MPASAGMTVMGSTHARGIVELDRRAFNPKHSYETAQLNHYALRSREEYQDKLRRRMPEPIEGGWKYAKLADPEAFWSRHDFGETEDRSIDSWTDKASILRSEFGGSLEERRKDTAKTANSVSAMIASNASA